MKKTFQKSASNDAKQLPTTPTRSNLSTISEFPPGPATSREDQEREIAERLRLRAIELWRADDGEWERVFAEIAEMIGSERKKTMTDERFNYLVNEGALAHPLIAFRMTRLALALKYVVDGCGKQGADMLEAWCESRNEQDERNGIKADLENSVGPGGPV
jgi:hypothetical protein